MATLDLKLIDNGDGGDFVLKGSDIEIVSGFQNMPYIGMFGGNYDSSTKKTNQSEQRFDYWANDLFFQNESSIQFNSDLERTLDKVALTSSTRLLILEAIKSDLLFMGDFCEVTPFVSVVSVDRVEILLKIKELNNQSLTEFIYIWDSTKKELITNVV